ncbi:MAG: DnaJ domain-containing protein [Chitinophagales bacterium]
MRNYIKWVLMILGLSRGGFLGGIIGFTVGYIIEEVLNGNLEISNNEVFKKTDYKYTEYQKNLLAIISEVVKADGYINKAEIYFIKKYLLNQFGSIYSNMMLKTLKLTVDIDHDIDEVTRKLRNLLDKPKRINLVVFLYELTLQNGSISNKEKSLLERIAKVIGLTEIEYEKIIHKKRKQNKSTSSRTKTFAYNPYKVLQTTENASDIEVKKAYRKMVLKYHPDKSSAQDEVANEKFNAISEAYHIIKQRRNIK